MEGEWRIMAANEVAVLQKDITDQVSNKLSDLESSGLALPANYNAQNALKSAFFKLQGVKTSKKDGLRPALLHCTKESIANALLDMVTQGLSPAKTQCYFIVYGKELQLQRSYFGTQAVAKRLSEVDDVWAEIVHEGDEFEVGSDKGRLVVTNFKPSFENMDKKIIGGFAVVKRSDGIDDYTVMTNNQIETSWQQSKQSHDGNKNDVQTKFSEEMAKRTLLNRACKNIINTSDDSDLLIDAVSRTLDNEYENDTERKDVTETPQDTVAGKFEEQFKKRKPIDVVETEESEDNASDGQQEQDAGTGAKQRQLL